MAITVGTDTYITVADADTYVDLFYLSADAKKVAWDLLSDADKEILLRRATQSLENIKYPGFKQEENQTLSFPRHSNALIPLRRNYTYSAYWSDLWLESTAVPDDVKFSEVEEALEMASPSSDSGRKATLTSGLKNWSLGKWSQTNHGGGSGTGTPATILLSIKAQELLASLSNGSFSVK